MTITILLRGTLLSLALLTACMAHGGVPPLNVTISDASGKRAFKGVTNGEGAFASTNLKAGDYVVQLNSTNKEMKPFYYAIVVSAGTKKVAAAGVPGEKFTAGGVALKVVVGEGLNITGQVARDEAGKMGWGHPQYQHAGSP